MLGLLKALLDSHSNLTRVDVEIPKLTRPMKICRCNSGISGPHRSWSAYLDADGLQSTKSATNKSGSEIEKQSEHRPDLPQYLQSLQFQHQC